MFHSFQSCLFLFRFIPPASAKQQPITRLILEYQTKGSNRKLTIQPLSWPCPCAPHRLPSGRPQHGSPGLLSRSWISRWTCHFKECFLFDCSYFNLSQRIGFLSPLCVWVASTRKKWSTRSAVSLRWISKVSTWKKNQSNLTLTLINSTTLLFWWIHLLLFQRTQSLLERHGHFKGLTSKPKSTTWIIFLRVWRSWPVNAGSLQSDAGKVGGSAFVQEELGGEGGFWEATAAKEKIGLSLKGGLKIGVGSSNCPPLSSFSPGIVKSWKSAPSLIIPMCIIMRRRMRRVKKQTNPILAIFNKVQRQLKGGEGKSIQLSDVAFY